MCVHRTSITICPTLFCVQHDDVTKDNIITKDKLDFFNIQGECFPSRSGLFRSGYLRYNVIAGSGRGMLWQSLLLLRKTRLPAGNQWFTLDPVKKHSLPANCIILLICIDNSVNLYNQYIFAFHTLANPKFSNILK